jgi:mannose-1-phosphate guanylyltransferase
MWADHHVRDVDGYVHSFKVAGQISKRDGKIVLIGGEPGYPATGYGYIQKDGIHDEEHYVFKVHSFTEKPAFEVARQYVKSGNYLWNFGYFVGSPRTMGNEIKKYAPKLYQGYQKLLAAKTPEEFNQVYLGLENIPIEPAFMVKAKDLLVVPASFDWMDIGSYGDLHKAVESDESGNHKHGGTIELEEVENSFVQNHTETPVAVIGLDNIVVINSPNGILVARKDMSQKVGEVSKRLSNK